jgi:hypothetical protein
MQTYSSQSPLLLTPLDETRMFARRRYRRVLGGLLGAGLGMFVALFSQCINPILVPSVNFYQPPFGVVINILLATLIGGLLGLITTWPTSSVNGVLLGGAAAGLLLGVILFIAAKDESGLSLGGQASMSILLLPLFGLAVPVTLFFRLAVNRSEEARRDPRHAWQVIGLPALLLLVAALIGLMKTVPTAGRVELVATKQLIDENIGSAALPIPLHPPLVTSFATRAQGPYELEWIDHELNRFAIPRGSLENETEHAVVMAHFKNGYWLACLYENQQDVPACRDWLPEGKIP